ncbi:MAG: hypothetical protein KDD53_06970, partial [Bdellovibrionales bacterium]|nr:hypothetical protein [Bdellovibrionales bacterium]
LEKIYRAAELMLRAGKDLQTIATRTRLPLEEIHALSQKVAESSGAQVNSTPRISRRPDIHRETQLV